MQRSRDDGKTWERESIVVKPNGLGHGTSNNVPIDVLCSESGITLKHGKHKGRLLMPGRCQPPDGGRDQKHWPYHYNTAIYSDDGAKTWPVKRLVHEKHSAYSSLAADKKGNIYCLFEREGTVSVARFNLEWLTQRQDWQSLFPDGETK